MSKEVMVKQENQVAVATDMNEWGVPQHMSTKDIVIPKLLPMQGLSVLVTERKAQMGEFRDSLTGKLLGSIDKPVEFIPFYVQKTWDIQEEQMDAKGAPNGKYKWARSLPLIENPLDPNYNDNLEWTGVENGVNIKRIRRMNVYCLVPSADAGLPYVLSFKSTSLKEGKKLFTQMYVSNIRGGKPPAAYSFQLGGIIDKNDQGSFVVPQVSISRETTQEELKECLSWIKIINKGGVKVDESDEVQTTPNEPVDVSNTGDY